MDKVKIAIISPGKLPIPAIEGGAVETLIDIFISHAMKYHQIDVYSVADIDSNCEIQNGSTRYYQIERKQIRRRWYSPFIIKVSPCYEYRYYLRYIKKKLRENRYDFIIVENRPAFISEIGKIANSKIILHVHNKNFSKRGLQLYYISKYCTSVFAVSDYIKREIDEIYKGRIKTRVLHNGIDANKFRKITDPLERISIRKKYGILENDFVIVFTGRICKEKGVLELIRAFSQLNDIYGFTLLVIGSAWFGANSEDSYIRMVKDIASTCKNKIVFTGYVDNSEVARIEGASDIAVLPSLWDDPLPLSIIEAMACELPVITTQSGGIPEMCDSQTGYLLERSEHLASDISECILKLYSDKKLRDDMGCAGRLKVERFFTTNDYCTRFLKLLNQSNNDETV